jgi:hypothetical protein
MTDDQTPPESKTPATKKRRKKPKPPGRPPIQLPSDWEAVLGAYLAKNPLGSLAQIARVFRVSRSVVDRWRKTDPNFQTVMDAMRMDALMPIDKAMLQAVVEDRSVGAATLLYRRVPDSLDPRTDESQQRQQPQITINVAGVPQEHVQRIRDIRGEALQELPNTLPDRNPDADVPLRPGSSFVPDVAPPGITIEWTDPDTDPDA